ncbi:hypothetical protein BVC80_1483g17 [Macleaya cordata]|uniref:LOB domain-containing protein n=1 Tax=Macleaya cordata TaxID=56857 RepID=A0A200QNH5_MACCD|nr:hypothetical protein BVC80_1483g17 [Macleaya cordata]
MTVKGGTSHACAACKYQRRKCSADCPLAPYFPPDQPKMFQNAHRLFGVRNILNILKPLDPSQKMEAMRSIVYESNIRARSPVGGCHGIIWQLQYQLQQTLLELQLVNTQLAIYRQNQNHPPLPPSQLQLGTTPTTTSPNNTLPLFQHHQPFDPGMSLQAFSNENHPSYSNAVAADYMISKDDIVNPLWMQHAYNNTSNNNNNNTMAIQSQLFDEQPISFQQEADEAPQDYDEMPVFFDTIDDRQSYIDSKEGYESSPESSLRDTTQSIEHVSENELKSAAACFSLTSVN